MGLCASTADPSTEPEPVIKESQPEKKLDPKDFMLQKLTEQVIVREPGFATLNWIPSLATCRSIAGQQFIVEECTNCDIYLLDNSAMVTVDDCTDCRVCVPITKPGLVYIIRPSSVFLRNCKNIQAVVACQQLRTRDCVGLELLLYCSAGQPVIEASHGIRLGCFRFNYFSLRAQFEAAGLNPWDNGWSNVHDFNASADSKNWELLPESVGPHDLIKPLAEVSATTQETEGFVVPDSWGARPHSLDERGFALVVGRLDSAYDLLERLQQQLSPESLLLIKSRRSLPSQRHALEQFMGRSQAPKAALSAIAQGTGLGLEFAGSGDGLAALRAAAAELSDHVVVAQDSESARSVAASFFVEIKV